jgi:aryl-alcohol dehydrogenase-like predicted oxidoreductase
MNYRLLGRTGVKVSELCLGTMTFGENFFNIAVVDQLSADAMVARALDAGVNFFDTADVYSYGLRDRARQDNHRDESSQRNERAGNYRHG